jgi:hypothetical protein
LSIARNDSQGSAAATTIDALSPEEGDRTVVPASWT